MQKHMTFMQLCSALSPLKVTLPVYIVITPANNVRF